MRAPAAALREAEASYRADVPHDASFASVPALDAGWISQRDQPMPRTRDPLELWARFDLPAVGAGQSILIDSSPWERAEFYFVRGGRLVGRQLTGILVPPGERTPHVSMTLLFYHSG